MEGVASLPLYLTILLYMKQAYNKKMNNKIIYFSDLHLERHSEDVALNFVNQLNDEIKFHKKNKHFPIIVIAGDFHNGVQGYKYMERIHAPIVYVAGNHEYYDGDFFNVNNELIKNQPKNVNFLYNHFVIIDDTIFLGSTLWSDLGTTFNLDLLSESKNIMNDEYDITAKKWYTNSNIEKLKLTYDYIDHKLEKKTWNVLIEIEENKKTTQFFNCFAFVYNILKQNIVNKNSHCSDLEQIILSINNFNQNKLIDFYKQNSVECENIFKKLNHLYINNSLKDKKIICVTHHIPFLEEQFLGYHRDYKDKLDILNRIDSINSKMYLVNTSASYHYDGFLYDCKKQRVDDNNILNIIHYFNNGDKNINTEFISLVDTWIHGHNHNYNCEIYLKNIKVATNPIGYYISRDTQLYFANLDNIKHNQDEIKNFVYSNFNKNEIAEKIDFLIFTMKHLTQSILTNKTEKIINIINHSVLFQTQQLNEYIEKMEVYLNLNMNKNLNIIDIALKNKTKNYIKFDLINNNFDYLRKVDKNLFLNEINKQVDILSLIKTKLQKNKISWFNLSYEEKENINRKNTMTINFDSKFNF